MNAVGRKFTGVTRTQFQGLCQLVDAKTGVVITSDSGTASDPKKKYVISWTFIESTGELVVTCTKAPFPENLVPAKIGDAIAQMVNDALKA